jgi:periplasmic divalent cation tolerance protein
MMSKPKESAFGVVLVSVATEEQGRAIAKTLLHEKLAACVSLFPIQSLYTWQDELHQEAEWQLLIKTDLTYFRTLDARVRELHTYDVPEIIALPIVDGSYLYLNWMKTQALSNDVTASS